MKEERIYTVYCHENKINCHRYIGQTKSNPQERWGKTGHRYKGSKRFYDAIKKYGWNNFTHEIIATNLTKAEADWYERLFISFFNTNGSGGYNIQDGVAFCMDFAMGNNPRARKVMCDGRIFSCAKECSEYYDENYHTMFNWLSGEKRMPNKYLDMGLCFVDGSTEYQKQKRHTRISVVCDGVVYNTITDCAKFYGVRDNRMSRWLSGARSMPQTFIDMGLAYWNGGDAV